MFIVHEEVPDQFVQISTNQMVMHKSGEKQASVHTIMAMQPNQMAEYNVYRVAPAEVPTGKKATGYSFQRVNGAVEQVLILEDFIEPLMPLTPWQFRKALRHFEKKEEVDAFLATQPEEVVEAYEYATSISREDPLAVGCQMALGWTDEFTDEFFRVGATL